MRSCLIQFLIVAVIAFLLLWVGLPLAVNALATSALNASGFSGTGTKVEVSENPPPLLILGHADKVHITSSDVTVGDLHAAAIDVTLESVDLLNRKVGSVTGTLTSVSVAAPNGGTVSLTTVTLSGPATETVATCTMSVIQTEALAESQLQAQGVDAQVNLAAPDLVTLRVGGVSYTGRLVVSEGALYLVPEAKSLPSVLLIQPGSGNPFHITSVNIGATDVTLTGTINVQDLLS